VALQFLQVCLILWYSLLQTLNMQPYNIPGHGQINDCAQQQAFPWEHSELTSVNDSELQEGQKIGKLVLEKIAFGKTFYPEEESKGYYIILAKS
jgi:hypothetical protein